MFRKICIAAPIIASACNKPYPAAAVQSFLKSSFLRFSNSVFPPFNRTRIAFFGGTLGRAPCIVDFNDFFKFRIEVLEIAKSSFPRSKRGDGNQFLGIICLEDFFQ